MVHPAHGPVRVTASPFHVDGVPLAPRGPAPYRPGEDTQAVMADVLGYTPERIAALAVEGAVVGPGLVPSRAGRSPLADAPRGE